MGILGEHFKIDFSKLKAKDEMVFQGQNYRITVLTERLIRLEYSQTGIFYDNPTQLVMFRNFEVPKFEVKQDDKYIEIKTEYFTLEYAKEKSFDGGKLMPHSNLRVTTPGEDNKMWFYNHAEAKNYKGSYVSLDGIESNSKEKNGLYSLDGFASIDDSNSCIFNEDGVLLAKDTKNIDIYLFVYNNDFNKALNDYYKLTGFPPMIPRYALGNWWCRDLDYKTEDILEVVNDFEKRELPLSVFLLDKGWHKSLDEKGNPINTGFSFNKDLIPNPEELIKQLHEKNVRIGLNIDPTEGIHPTEDHYEEIAKHFNVENNKIIAFDPTNPNLLNAYFKMLINPLEEIGIDFFWNDYQNKDENLLPLWLLDHYHFEDFSRNKTKRGIILGRNPLIGSHRYPISYSGKTLVSWDTLRKIPIYNQNAANAGVSWWSYDIAGNFGGIEDPELYIRSVQLGTFSPILRFHAPRGKYYKKEPWRWDIKTLETVDEYLKLRHKLIPYTYTEAYKYHKNGVPLIRPLYYQYPWVYDDSNYRNQYYFGDEMMIAPILNKKETLMNRTVHKFFMPDGTWYDFKTGKKFPGGKNYLSFFKEEDYPVFVKSGSIIPLSTKSNANNIGNPEAMEIHVFPGKNNTYVLYEDDGITSLCDEGYYLLTSIDYNYLPSNYTVIIRSIEGKNAIVPEYRDYTIKFRNTKKAENVIAYYNDTMIETKCYVDDADFVVELKQVPTVGQVTVNCKGKDIEIDAIRLINDDIDSILLDLPINTVLKEKISEIVFSNIPIKKKRIEIRKLKRYGLSSEYVKLFLKLLEYIEQI